MKALQMTLHPTTRASLAVAMMLGVAASATYAQTAPAPSTDLDDQQMEEDGGGDGLHGGDFAVMLGTSPGGQALVISPTVLGADLSADNSFATDEPGYDSDPGTFDPGSSIGFNILQPLALWNGSGFDDLNPTIDETLAITYAFSAANIDRRDTAAGPVDGFTVPVNGEGAWHRHLTYTLLGDGGSITDAPDDGIYKLALALFASDDNIADSNPFSIVFNLGLSENEHDAAIAFALQPASPDPDPVTPIDPVTPVDPGTPTVVPTPAASLLGAPLLLLLATRRKRE